MQEIKKKNFVKSNDKKKNHCPKNRKILQENLLEMPRNCKKKKSKNEMTKNKAEKLQKIQIKLKNQAKKL